MGNVPSIHRRDAGITERRRQIEMINDALRNHARCGSGLKCLVPVKKSLFAQTRDDFHCRGFYIHLAADHLFEVFPSDSRYFGFTSSENDMEKSYFSATDYVRCLVRAQLLYFENMMIGIPHNRFDNITYFEPIRPHRHVVDYFYAHGFNIFHGRVERRPPHMEIEIVSQTTEDSSNDDSTITADDDTKNDENDGASLTCVICLDKKRRVVFMPCKHLCTCSKCAHECKNCPLCRSEIQKRVGVFI
jgi:hypothetical protein